MGLFTLSEEEKKKARERDGGMTGVLQSVEAGGDHILNPVKNLLGLGPTAKTTWRAKSHVVDPTAFGVNDSNRTSNYLHETEANKRDTPQMAAANAGQVAINQAPQDQFREGQTALGQQLAARAAGQVPSAAEMQMRQGLDGAIAAQRSAAASARGVSPGLAQRLAAQGTAQAQSQVAGQTAQLRAQEQAQAEQALGQHLAAARSQDIGLATGQAGLTQQTNLANAGFVQGANQSNQGAEFQARGQQDQNNQFYANLAQARDFAEQQALEDREAMISANRNATNATNSGIYTSNTDSENKHRAGILGAVGSAAGALLASDKRNKTDIKDGSETSEQFLDGLKAYRFRYKDGGGEHLGVMAQDVEKAPGGKGMVIDTPKGKFIDAGQGVGRLLAAAAEMHRRIEKLEGARK